MTEVRKESENRANPCRKIIQNFAEKNQAMAAPFTVSSFKFVTIFGCW